MREIRSAGSAVVGQEKTAFFGPDCFIARLLSFEVYLRRGSEGGKNALAVYVERA
jgi:hypothetical protein